MSQKAIPAVPQYNFVGQANVTTANASLTSPTNTQLIAVAGPDGSDIWQIGCIATATQTSANTIELFISKDFGATFAALPMTGTFGAGAAAGATTNIALPNTVPGGPTSPFVLGGGPGAFTYTMTQSLLTENANYYQAQYPSAGTANAQTLAQVYNTANTAYGTAFVAGRVVDFIAGATNSGALTLAVGGGVATAVTTSAGAALTGNEVTKGWRYRVIDTGSGWILVGTDRLYAAITQTQALTVTAWGQHR